MAAPTVTFVQRKTMQLDGASFGLMTGSVNVTSYDNTHPAVTAITGKARQNSTLTVIPDAVSSGGYAITWDPASTSFKAYTTGSALSGVLAEAANAAAVGTFGFVLIGQLG